MNTYIFDPGWQKECDRLRGMETLFDRYTTQCLLDLGVSEGWQCLEVGCGAGSIALWLAEHVGSSGRVVAVDLDTRFIEGHGKANLDLRQQNILTGALADGAFDLAHARAVLEHIPDRQRALERMISTVRPGGWLVVEATDFGGTTAATLARYADPLEDAPLLERIFHAVEAVFTAVGGDAGFGRRLIGALKDAGLENIAGEVHTPLEPGGGEWGRGTIEQLAEHLVHTKLVTAADVDRVLTLTADRSRYGAPPFMVTAWGQRPAA